ncbi:hypothetical protein BD779DRAFT_1450043, partial [Infundibulicybe gibba]
MKRIDKKLHGDPENLTSATYPQLQHNNTSGDEVLGDTSKFPPSPLTKELAASIVAGFCRDSSPECFEESGCAVCGQLT